MTDDRHARRLRGLRLAIVALFSVLVTCVTPGAALAQNGHVKLALLPVGQSGSFFDLTMAPGETRSLQVEIANNGEGALAARTYAADVYTIINGGFGGRLRDEPQTGTTQWLDYPTDVLQLVAGMSTRRSFTVVVPANAGPGEYITSVVLENDQPILGGGAVALNQVVRQAIAVVVTVPGQRSPALAIGEATHKVVAGTSVVAIAVENTGNVRLKPIGEFTLLDSAGAQVSQASVPMDTFYAHTRTLLEVPLAALLLPGTYTVRLTLDDAAQGARADKAAIALVIEAPSEGAVNAGTVPGLTKVIQNVGAGQIALPVWSVIIAAALALGLVIAWLILVLGRRRWTRTSE
jgi:hypothetical protein